MPKLTKEQRAELEAQLAADDADDEDDFEVEIEDVTAGKKMRLPYSRGRSFAQKHFGIDLDPEPAAEPDEPADPKAKPDLKAVPAHFRSRRSS